MKNLLKLVFMWILSLIISLWIVYWAWKLITNLNQTAVKWDVITSDWVNAVNNSTKNSDYKLQKYCVANYSNNTSYTNTHRSITLVPDSWTKSDCANFANSLKWWAAIVWYNLICMFDDGTSSVWADNWWIPQPNCWWN